MKAMKDSEKTLDELFEQLDLKSSSAADRTGVNSQAINSYAETNPYLAHLNTGKGSNAIALGSKEPLFGFVPRRVNEKQVQKVMVRLSTHLLLPK
jgi:hypothetical protein